MKHKSGSPGLSKAQQGQQNWDRFCTWLDGHLSQGTTPWTAEGKISRVAIVSDLNVSRSVFQQNPRIRLVLSILESGESFGQLDELVEQGTLSGSLAVKITASRRETGGRPMADLVASGHRPAKETSQDNKIQRLESRLVAMEEENRFLRRELERLGYVLDHVPDAGRLPW